MLPIMLNLHWTQNNYLKKIIKATQASIIPKVQFTAISSRWKNKRETGNDITKQNDNYNYKRNLKCTFFCLSRCEDRLRVKTHTAVHSNTHTYREAEHAYLHRKGEFKSPPGFLVKRRQMTRSACVLLMSTQLLLHTVADWFHMNPSLRQIKKEWETPLVSCGGKV